LVFIISEQISIILEGDIQYQIQRDLVFENQIKQQFEALGFVSDFSKPFCYLCFTRQCYMRMKRVCHHTYF
jgi:hypothetical protein